MELIIITKTARVYRTNCVSVFILFDLRSWYAFGPLNTDSQYSFSQQQHSYILFDLAAAGVKCHMVAIKCFPGLLHISSATIIYFILLHCSCLQVPSAKCQTAVMKCLFVDHYISRTAIIYSF